MGRFSLGSGRSSNDIGKDSLSSDVNDQCRKANRIQVLIANYSGELLVEEQPIFIVDVIVPMPMRMPGLARIVCDSFGGDMVAMKAVKNPASDDLYSFITFFNYFKAIELSYALEGINSTERLIDAVKKQNLNLNRKNPITAENEERLKQCLFHSWNSQIHLYQYHLMDDDYISISVQWLPTMFYYTLYHCLQAYFAASGKPHTPNHTEALRVISLESWRFPSFMGARCTSLLPELAFDGLIVDREALNRTSNLTVPNANNCGLHLARMLKTTRSQYLHEAFESKRRSSKKRRLSSEQKASCDRAICQTSVFHFLYRMRKRFNYEDGEVGHQIDNGTGGPRSMYLAIRNAYLGYAYCLEWLTAAYAGRTRFDNVFSQFKGRMQNKLAVEPLEKMESRIGLYY